MPHSFRSLLYLSPEVKEAQDHLCFHTTTLRHGKVFSVLLFDQKRDSQSCSCQKRHHSGFREQDITAILVCFGVSVTLGNLAEGRLVDWNIVPTAINFLLVCWYEKIMFYTV